MVYDDEDQLDVGFARRYRPARFEDYIGNTKMKQTIFQRLRYATEGKASWPQTLMLTGKTGCGKTTMARIIMREYTCENRDPILGACGECPSCEMMDDYIRYGKTDNLYDVYEVDIGDKSRKDEIKSLSEEMTYPGTGQWKIYLLDEFHMASEGAQTGLLKRIEEPPEGVIIILATTDPEKVLDSIRNRMQLKLVVERPSTKELTAHLATICSTEGVPYDNEGLRVICNRSGNVIRDALNHLEQVVNSRKSAESHEVLDEFDEIGDEVMFKFLQAYKNRDYVAYSTLLYEISNNKSLETFLGTLTSFVLRGIYVINNAQVDGLNTKELGQYKKLFSEFDPGEIAEMLSRLNSMRVGNIEANFLSFIYDTPSTTTVVSAPIVTEGTAPEEKLRSTRIRDITESHIKINKRNLENAAQPMNKEDFLKTLGAVKVN